MTTFHGQTTQLYQHKELADCGCKPSSCEGFDVSSAVVPYGGLLRNDMDSIKSNIEQSKSSYGKLPVLAVGDAIELYEIPTYAELNALTVFHDGDLNGFKFKVEVADVLDGENCVRTVTPRAAVKPVLHKEAGTTVTYGTAPAAFAEIGAAVGRETYKFTGVDNIHRAVVRIVFTAVPAVPAAGQPPAPSFFDVKGLHTSARFHRYGVCVCSIPETGSYDKDAVTTVT